jgi:hypothetical protein
MRGGSWVLLYSALYLPALDTYLSTQPYKQIEELNVLLYIFIAFLE